MWDYANDKFNEFQVNRDFARLARDNWTHAEYVALRRKASWMDRIRCENPLVSNDHEDDGA